MPRKQRVKSKSGYYHIMLRGNERKNIFMDDYDREHFIEIIRQKKQNNRFSLHSFCLMDNHVHLMLSEGTENIAQVMKRITVSYVRYFNWKYKRTGHLFQDRYKSEIIEDDQYVQSLIRYIHQNPVKAGLVKKVADYKWSSHYSYINTKDSFEGLIDNEVIISIFSEKRESAYKLYQEFMNQETMEKFLDMEEVDKGSVEKAAREKFEFMKREHELSPHTQDMVNISDDLIRELRKETGLSIRKLAEIMNINKDRVNKALKN